MSEEDNIKLNIQLNDSNQLTNSVEQSPSLEINRSSASQEIPHVLYNQIHKPPPPAHILNPFSPVNAHPSHFLKIHFNIIYFSHLSLGLPGGLFPSDLPTEALYTPPLSPVYATCPTHLFLSI